ncbi:unnamed protein product [Citrullus colocynthis]|uniref:Uncharacterized protein n=1 Tax=Citrullus colocynthis TaxID=252529 RepID=A0ABP0Z4A3_9ROSI
MAATSRLARFISEACPPQVVSVMRRRSPKVLDTINEEDQREALASSSSLKIEKFSVSSPPSPMAASPTSPASSTAVNSKYFLDQISSPRRTWLPPRISEWVELCCGDLMFLCNDTALRFQ